MSKDKEVQTKKTVSPVERALHKAILTMINQSGINAISYIEAIDIEELEAILHAIPDFANRDIATIMKPIFYVSSAEMVKLLVAHGADVNALGSDRKTPLHIHATKSEHIDVVIELLNAGANPAARCTYNSYKPVQFASGNDKMRLVLQLAEGTLPQSHGAGATQLSESLRWKLLPGLIHAITNMGDLTEETVELLTNNNDLVQILHAAIEYERAEELEQIFKFLPEEIVSQYINNEDDPLLQYAIMHHSPEAMDVMVKYGADLLHTWGDSDAGAAPQYTTLSVASTHGCLDALAESLHNHHDASQKHCLVMKDADTFDIEASMKMMQQYNQFMEQLAQYQDSEEDAEAQSPSYAANEGESKGDEGIDEGAGRGSGAAAAGIADAAVTAGFGAGGNATLDGDGDAVALTGADGSSASADHE